LHCFTLQLAADYAEEEPTFFRIQFAFVFKVDVWQKAMNMNATTLAKLCTSPNPNFWRRAELQRDALLPFDLVKERRVAQGEWHIGRIAFWLGVRV
jgi:hypothetical protein